LVVAWLNELNHPYPDDNNGIALFIRLNEALFWAIWIFTPLMVADCVSREKREGTLGLLFLTPLKAREIIIAKGLSHGLRSLTLCLAVIPVIMIPITLGGLGYAEVLLSILINLSAVALALTAGLLASAFSKSWTRGTLIACLLALLALVLFLYLLGFGFVSVFMVWPGTQDATVLLYFDRIVAAGYYVADGSWLGRTSGPSPSILNVLAGLVALLSLAIFWAATSFGARVMRKNWQELPPPPWQVKSETILLRPVGNPTFLKRWQQGRLDRNPVGWLQRRTWSARMTSWAWFATAAMATTYCIGRDGYSMGTDELQFILAALLATLAATAASSFRRERENGVLELLLISPTHESRIIWGRLFGIWSQFTAAFLWVGGVWAWFCPPDERLLALGIFVGCFFTLPICGLYFSLHRKSFMAAFLMSLLAGVVLPLVVGCGQGLVWEVMNSSPFYHEASIAVWTVAVQALMASVIVYRLHADLKRRNFAFNHGAG